MKEIRLMFYQTNPSPDNIGLKQVLYEVTDKGKVIHDFGYSFWDGKEWELPNVPKGMKLSVHSWANNPDPKHLIGKIII